MPSTRLVLSEHALARIKERFPDLSAWPAHSIEKAVLANFKHGTDVPEAFVIVNVRLRKIQIRGLNIYLIVKDTEHASTIVTAMREEDYQGCGARYR